MDVQFVDENTLAVANYVAGYVSKPEKNCSDMYDEIDNSKSICQQLYAYAFAKLRNRECGIIEAIDRLLGQELYFKTRVMLYLNARMPSARTVQLKGYHALKKLNPESNDKYEKNWIDDFYPNRPECLENESYYMVRSCYDKCDKKEMKDKNLLLLKGLGGLKRRAEKYLISHTVFSKPNQLHEYRYSLLLLFMPFRDETKELLDETGKCDSIFEQQLVSNPLLAEHHEQLQDQIANIAEREERMKKAQTEMTQSQDAEEMDPLGQPLHVDNAMAELAAAMAVRDTDTSLDDDVARMNQDQLRVFNKVNALLEESKKGPGRSFRMFVSGAGGTGKSFLIHAIKKLIQSQQESTTDIGVAIAAPTGLAAFNVNGITCHRLFKLPVQHQKEAAYYSLRKDEIKKSAGELRQLQLCIIDEISMVSAIMLIYINKRLQEIFNSPHPFADKNVLVFGDLMQLAPVNAPYVFETVHRETIVKLNLGLGSNNVWLRDFNQYDELLINERQRDDPMYAAILERLRFGLMTEADVETVSSKIISLEKAVGETKLQAIVDHFLNLQEQDPAIICLLPTRVMVNMFNNQVLQTVSTEIVTVRAICKIVGCKTTAQLKRSEAQLAKRADNVTTTAGIELSVDLAIGVRIMLRWNVDTLKGLVNGSLGIVTDFNYDAAGLLTAIMIKFDKILEPQKILREKTEFKLSNKITCFIEQFPLVLSYAITTHKSQGTSLNSVLVEVGNKTFQDGMCYVSLSRVRTLTGLNIINFDPSKASCSKPCLREIQRLREMRNAALPEQQPLPDCVVNGKINIIELAAKSDRKWYTSIERSAKHAVVESLSPRPNTPAKCRPAKRTGVRTPKKQGTNVTTDNFRSPFSKRGRSDAVVTPERSRGRGIRTFTSDDFISPDSKRARGRGRGRGRGQGRGRGERIFSPTAFISPDSKRGRVAERTPQKTTIDEAPIIAQRGRGRARGRPRARGRAARGRGRGSSERERQFGEPTNTEDFDPKTPSPTSSRLAPRGTRGRRGVSNLARQFEQDDAIVPAQTRYPHFVNSDGESCYANSALHLLFACYDFRNVVRSDVARRQLPDVIGLFDNYLTAANSGQSLRLDATGVRNNLGAPFLRGQQCSREFILAVLQKVDRTDFFNIPIDNTCVNEECVGFRAHFATTTDLLSINPRDGFAFDQHVANWQMITAARCQACSTDNLQSRLQLESGPKLLLIQITRHEYVHRVAQYYDDAILGFDENNIIIAGFRYKVLGLIQHFGPTLNSGHYVSFVERGGRYLHFNDIKAPYVSFAPLPQGLQNVYLILLEKYEQNVFI